MEHHGELFFVKQSFDNAPFEPAHPRSPALVSLRVVFPSSPSGHTAQRRANIALPCLRNEKLSAGDWIRISCGGKSVIAQAWPSLSINEDEVVLSRIHQLALGDPVQVDLERLDGKDVKWMTAKAVTISVQASGSKGAVSEDKSREREAAWELALLKEILRKFYTIESAHGLTRIHFDRGPPIHLYRLHSHTPDRKPAEC
jgi:hypothetical protein